MLKHYTKMLAQLMAINPFADIYAFSHVTTSLAFENVGKGSIWIHISHTLCFQPLV